MKGAVNAFNKLFDSKPNIRIGGIFQKGEPKVKRKSKSFNADAV